MRHLAVTAAVALLATSSAFSENVKQILSQKYVEVSRAMQRQDVSPVRAILAPEYRAIAPNGKSLGRDDILKQFEFQAKSVTDLSWPRKITEFHLGRGVATVMVSGHFSAKTKTKPPRRLDLFATTKDSWKKINGKWLLAASQLVKSQMTLDGKPANFSRH